MSDEEELFTESDGGSDFSASEEDEWVPEKKGGKKSKKETSSDEDESEDDESGSGEDSDFAESLAKRTGKQTNSSRKRPAPTSAPKPSTAGGGKRKRLSPGLRDRLYHQYKKDLLKEITPVRPPLNSSVSEILQKCKYQRKGGSVGSQGKGDDSDSSGDDHLVDPEKLDLGSTFFNKDESKESGKSGPPQFDVNAGMHLSDSSDGEDQGTSGATGEELLPASIPKQAADKLISHINQQSGEFMNFHNLDQFTAKVEEAKKLLKNYQQKAAEHGEPGTTKGDNVASAAKQQKESVSNLLALGETDTAGSPRTVQSNASSDSEWEEVQTGEAQKEEMGEIDSEQKPKDITIEMDTAQSRRKRREELEMELYIKRQINKVKRANQLNYHKSSILAALAIGQQLNQTISCARVSGILLSIMQEKASAGSAKWDEKKVQNLADWFHAEFTLQSNQYLGARTGCSLSFVLSLALYTRKVMCRRDYTLLFLACLRMAGAPARIVLSASVPPKRPPLSELCPMSERQIKENATKRQSTNNPQIPAPMKSESKPEITSNAIEMENSNQDIKVPDNIRVEEPQQKIKTPTKENVIEKVQVKKRVPQKAAPRRSARKALATLNIPQLDGGDDADNFLPLRRSLRSKSAPAVPVESPGSSPFTKRKSNTPAGGPAAATKSMVTRKRKLFPPQTESMENDTVPEAPGQRANRLSIRGKQAAKEKTDKGKHVLRKSVRPITPSDDEDFDAKRNKSNKKDKSDANAAAKKEIPKSNLKSSPAAKILVPVVILTKMIDRKEICGAKMDEAAKMKANKMEQLNVEKRSTDKDSFELEDEDMDRKMKTVGKRTSSQTRPVSSRNRSSSQLTATEKSSKKGRRNKTSSEYEDDNDDAESVNDDSDFEMPKVAPKRKSKSSPAPAKAKKSPATQQRSSGKVGGHRQAQTDKTDIWIEFFCDKSKRWITFDVSSGRIDCVDNIVRNATSPISYVFAWDNEGFVKDITARYVQNWNTACRMLRVEQGWLDKVLAPFVGRKTNRDVSEDKELNKLDADKPLPKTIGELKNHPLYALRRHLLKFEALYPAEPPTLGFIRGEAIYARGCVHTLQTREKWYKQGRVVRPFETAYKVVKCWKYDRPTNNWLKDQPCHIFGHWQTDEYDPPTAENHLVPRNEYGNVELFVEKMLPKGTVHLKLPGLNRVCRRLQIDCAPALTGFDMAKKRVVPVYDGFVVCQEFAEQVVDEWYKEMEQEEQREQEKLEKRVYGNWKRLIKGLLVRRKLQHKYNFDNLA